ncbi:MAG: histidine kinase [Bryobacterales bacterium]|nr:histidine kinase [Bryobacterales bacterium]
MLEQYLVILFVKLAVSASLASVLARPAFVQRMLLEEERSLDQRFKLALLFSVVFGTSVAMRVLSRNSYQAVDLGLEGCLLCGLIGGYVAGLSSGILISIPAMLHGEFLAMPLFAGVGVVGGLLRDLAPDKEEIWRMSPFFGLGIVKILKGPSGRYRLLFQLAFLLTVLFGEFLLVNLGRLFGKQFVFVLYPENPGTGTVFGTYLATLLAVILPLKVWNNTRNERKLEAQVALLTEARLAALTRQINPHFLFNTLNSVSSLIRTNPEQARKMVYKLSNILRRLLRKQENYSSMREELSFIEDYLSIELVRFGEKLRFQKEIDAATLDVMVPSMVLQPIVENSIKHGLGPKVEGGTIKLSSRNAGSRLLITVEDDGVGIAEEKLANLFGQGIGVSNVNERLKVLYGNDFRLSIHSTAGEGTRTEIEIPQLTPAVSAVS